MNKEFDCIVVGAGPAGSMAARTAAENGIRVLLLEKDPVIGIPLCCAEAISIYGMHQFFRPDPRWISAKINKLMLTSPSGHKAEVDHPDAAYVLDRKLFDKDLAVQAEAEGAEIRVNSCVTGLIRKDGEIKGLRVKENGEEMELGLME